MVKSQSARCPLSLSLPPELANELPWKALQARKRPRAHTVTICHRAYMADHTSLSALSLTHTHMQVI